MANQWEPEKAGPQNTPTLFYWCWRQFKRLSDYLEGINPPGGGEANTSSSKGTGVGLALPKDGVDLPIKSLRGGANVTITDEGQTVVINSDGGGAGEANTASDTGSGFGLTQAKNGVDLPFKSLLGGGDVTIIDTGSELLISADTDGETNTAVSRGAGEDLTLPKEGAVLPFRSLVGGANVTITPDNEQLIISSSGGGGGGSGSTDVDITQPAHGFDVLDVIRYDGNSDRFVLALADDEETLGLGLVIDVGDINNFTYSITGRYELPHGLLQDEWYYLSATDPGKLTRDPAAEGEVEQPILFTEGPNAFSVYAYRPHIVADPQEWMLDGGSASTIYDPIFNADGGGAQG